MIGAMGIAASGISVANTWLAVTANNIANADSVDANGNPYQAQVSTVAANPAGGASATSINSGQGVDLATEMPNLMMATDAYALNLAVFARAQDTYASIVAMAR
ncbi:MAG: hypothetical protein JWL83_1738 [Actinomycetia bacterium]|nr:hypothetical protein [Actinomycetes bacterium]